MVARYYKFSKSLHDRYGEKVWKVSIDAGLSCPNKDPKTGTGGCIFCRNDSFSHMMSEQHVCVDKQIEKGITLGRDVAGINKYIVYFQSSTNTFAPVKTLRKMFFDAIAYEGVVGISIATRPDCLPPAVLELLAELAEKTDVWVELGLQSCFNSTLEFINRGHTWEDYLEAVDKLLKLNVRICTHIMVGLPGESVEHSRETANRIALTGTHEIKVHPLLILTETGLAKMYHDGKVKELSMSEYIGQVCDIIERMPPAMVMQRLTAEAPREMLLAPRWVTNKIKVLNSIKAELERRDSYQGCKLVGA